MAEYEDEEVVDEEAPLSAEELFELHKEEINAAFEEKGFFRRFSDMLKGLTKPKSSAEYKLARVELNRLAAPILAVVLPTIAVIVLIVVIMMVMLVLIVVMMVVMAAAGAVLIMLMMVVMMFMVMLIVVMMMLMLLCDLFHQFCF